MTPQERFWAKVEKTSGCWVFTGAKAKNGYGFFKPDVRQMGAHRYAWLIERGAIPDGMRVLHRCDNPPCVRPEHLFLGTPRDNMRDMIAKGRHVRGDRHPLAAFGPEEADRIRSAYAAGGTTYKALAKQFGVSPGCIAKVIRREDWRSTDARLAALSEATP